MTRAQHIERLFQEAQQQAPGERNTWLRNACNGDSGLEREVASLLANHPEHDASASCAAAAAAQLNAGRASLAAGQCLGPYEIVKPIGKGGMGEVYRARDTRLKRDVAVKICAVQFSERFEREARVIAALNHPNICTLYDVGPNYLVMELVEGDNLYGPLPVETALNYARQIAEALEAAHEKGVVHRDLKPANIKVTPAGVVKVLDFGLAKAIEGPAASRDADSPTMTMSATRAGMILGSAAYMSPEQAAGKPADRRADIWSFGAVLYEMLAGKRAFDGESISETLANVLKDEPDWNALTAATPGWVRKLLKKCLTKDRRLRLQAIGDARVELESAPTEEALRVPARQESRLAFASAALFFATAAWLALIHFTERPPAPELMRFEIPAPERLGGNIAPIVSPNGRMIAFQASDPAGRSMLWVRFLDSLEIRPVPGTENAGTYPFWSWDNRFLAFVEGGKLKKVALSGGPPETLCEVSGAWRGGAWSRDGTIIFGRANHGLMQVSDAGGAAAPLTALDQSRHESFHGVPSFLPDGRHFCYSRFATAAQSLGFFTGTLDAKPEQQSATRLAPWVQGYYVPTANSSIGYVLFRRENALMAQGFDNRRLQLTGHPVLIAGDLPISLLGAPLYSGSETGVVAYSRASAVGQLTWFDREGKKLGALGEPTQHGGLILSPDGTRVAVSRTEGQTGNGRLDIWVHEFAHGTWDCLTARTVTRLAFGDLMAFQMPVWSPDDSRIAFRSGGRDILAIASNGVGGEVVLVKSSIGTVYPYDWSADGGFLLYSATGGTELWYLPLSGNDHEPINYLQAGFTPQGQFSPDGHYVAYTSAETGRNEIYVRSFPNGSDGKWPISTDGGTQPRWRRDGKELFYISGDSKLMSVGITTTPRFGNAGSPKALFSAPILAGGIGVFRYDVTRDGRKFLIDAVPTSASATRPAPITVVVNWPTLIEK